MWYSTDWKINGVTDPDFVQEADSSTYLLRADGTYEYFRVWYKKMGDTSRVDGTWEYIELKNQLVFYKSDKKRKDAEKWNIISSDSTTIVVGSKAHQIYYRKTP